MWPFRRKRRRRHIVGPYVQWDSTRARKRVLQLVEALALQSEAEYREALTLVPFEAIADERHLVWQHELWCRAAELLLTTQLAVCINERRLERVAEVIPLHRPECCDDCPCRDECKQLKEA